MSANCEWGPTGQEGNVVTLLTPVVSPPIQQSLIQDSEHTEDPIERKMTRRLAFALRAVRHATEQTMGGKVDAFLRAVDDGASANLCEALVRLIEPSTALEVSLIWARAHPMKPAREIVQFTNSDVPILREAARLFRDHGPKPDVLLFGSVQRVMRRQEETYGTITLRAYVDGRIHSVVAVLTQSDYERAIEAHQQKAPVIVAGDLDRIGQRWRLLNPRVVAVIPQEDMQEEGE